MIPAALVLALMAGAVVTAPLPPDRPASGPGPAPASEATSKVPHPSPEHESAQMVCRDPRLVGERARDIIDVGDLACGIDDPVRVTSVAGIRLTPPALVGCHTARRLADWLIGVAQPQARAQLGAGIAGVRVMGSYACRTRNNAGWRRSEHARGRAIDIGGFTLTNGAEVTVARDWGKTPDGQGSTLELQSLYGNYGDGHGWRASTEYGGSPGHAGTSPVHNVVINEVFSRPDDPSGDKIEIHNTALGPIDISGWYLSNRRPTEYFRSNICVAFRGDEPTMKAAVELVGDDNFTWDSDYPHPDGTFPPHRRAYQCPSTLGQREQRRRREPPDHYV